MTGPSMAFETASKLPLPAPALPGMGRTVRLALGVGLLNILFQLLAMRLYEAQGLFPGFLYGDPNSIAKQPPSYGMLTFLGVLLWATAGAVASFAGLARRGLVGRDGLAGFLLVGGLLTLAMAADDLFTFHENYARHVGLSEARVMAIYGLWAGFWLVAYRRDALRGEWLLLALGLAGLAGSAICDVLEDKLHLVLPVEEQCKQFGILFWALFLVRASWAALKPDRQG